MKDSFILYAEQSEVFKNLSDENAGKLIKAIFDYTTTGETDLDDLLNLIFIPIRQQLDRNEQKWQEAKQKRSEAGKKGMASRWNNKNNNDINNVTEDNNVIENDNNDNNVINVMKKNNNVKNDITKITVNVNDNVNDNVNVNDNINNNIKPKKAFKFIKPSLQEIESYIAEKDLNVNATQFFDYFEEGNWTDSKGQKVKNWKQKLLTWNKYSTKSDKKEYDKKPLNDLDILYEN